VLDRDIQPSSRSQESNGQLCAGVGGIAAPTTPWGTFEFVEVKTSVGLVSLPLPPVYGERGLG